MYSDPIADMLTRIRNAHMAGHANVSLPTSRLKEAIAQILKQEGYIEDFSVQQADGEPQGTLRVALKYVGARRERRPVISGIERVSSPGLRKYVGATEIPRVRNGLGMAILSTSQGVMSDSQARRAHTGGELLALVW